MTIRERINENPGMAATVAGVIIVVAAVLVLWQSSSTGGGAVAGSGRLYFTVDDGETWFPAEATNIPPFQHEGKTAYRVRVYKCPDGKETASHLERYNEAEVKRLRATDGGNIKDPSAAMQYLDSINAMEVKEPGGKQWVKLEPNTAARFAAITQPRCPDGSSNIQWVTPP